MERAWRTTLALLLVYAAPLLALWQRFSKERPGLALMAAIAWLIIVAVGWLFWRIAAESVNTQLARWRLAVDRLVDQRLSNYGKEYGRWVWHSRRFLDAKGLATVGTFSPELDEVFVDVGLTARAPQDVPTDLLSSGAPDSGQRQSIWDFLDQVHPKVLAVIGAPGSGKTTLLNHVARRTARTSRQRRRQIPVLLQLRDHAKTVAEEKDIQLPELVRRSLPRLETPEPNGWWENRLGRGRCVVLLDGLDEVANTGQRRDVVAWVNRQIALYPRNDFVVTSRPHGYQDAFVASASTLQVLSFTSEQVRKFLHGWYLAVERRATLTTGPEVEILARDAADDLLDRLAASPALFDLTINPLLLTMIANVHRFRRSLPSSRADLYGEVCEVMLWRRQEAKRLDLNLPGASKQRQLAWLAYEMMSSGTRDIERLQLLDGMRPRLKRVAREVTAEEFINDVGSNGLLVERERDLFAFAHLTFQEYLAARHIQEHRLERTLIESVDDPWWRETTLLYVALADADPIVEAALRSGTPTALSMAFECEEMGAELAPELRARLAEVMQRAFSPHAEPASRRLAAGVLASRNLRTLVPTPSGGRVCPAPVTAELYWLFRQDVHVPAPDGPGLRPDTPARGMWSTDVLAFVRWINQLVSTINGGPHQGAGILYRLPSGPELDDLLNGGGAAAQTIRSKARRVWILSDERTLSVWTPPEDPTGGLVTADDLLTAMVSDLRHSQVMNRLMTLTATELAERLNPQARILLDAATDLARRTQAARSGRDSGGLENTEALNVVRHQLKVMRGSASLLEAALQNLPATTAGISARIDHLLGEHRIDSAMTYLQSASSFGRDVALAQEWNRDLGIENVLPDTRGIRDRIGQCRIRVRAIGTAAEQPSSSLVEALALNGAKTRFVRDEDQIEHHRDALGRVLWQAVSGALRARAKEDERDTTTVLTSTLIRHAFGGTLSATPVDLGRVTRTLRRLSNGPDHTRGFTSPLWAAVVLDRLRGNATPVLGRQQPLTEEAAWLIRVPAIVLAAEAADAGLPELAADLRELAAATLLMRRRAGGQETLESLVLAIS